MQIRKNTKAHKSILQIVEACLTRPDREKLIRLYITRAGHTLQERISIEAIQGEADLLYDMTYQTVLNSLKSPNHQLQVSDELPGLYYFHSSNKEWDETPFEFDEAVLKLFPSLPEPPATRKKEKAEKYVLPTAPKTKSGSTPKPVAKKKTEEKKTVPSARKEEQQPNYRLKHKVLFTNLDAVVFRKPQTSKRDVLDYYNKVADHLLPHLKDRPVIIYRHASNGGIREYNSASSLIEDKVEIPDWIQTATKDRLLLCNDRDHLFFYQQAGAVAFAHRLAKVKSLDRPDYIIIALGDDTDWPVLVEAAYAAKSVLDGLKLPSAVKWNGSSGLHLYIALNGKRDFETAHDAARFICHLIKLKAPDLFTLPDTDNGYRKVLLDYNVNEQEASVIAPYSLSGPHPGVALPLSWDDINPDLKAAQFTLEAVMKSKRLPEFRHPTKKTDVRTLLENLKDLYGFLLQ